MGLMILYLVTFSVFLIIDYFALSYVIKPMFARDIGHLMLDNFRVLPAFAFYAFFVTVLLWFVSWPALTLERSLWWVFGNAALLGAVAYGTYEFTNLAILKDWTWRMVIIDGIWGTILTGTSATAGVWLMRALA
ncbi:MAG: DUF2177 family protein [Pseudomonadota bacterium]